MQLLLAHIWFQKVQKCLPDMSLLISARKDYFSEFEEMKQFAAKFLQVFWKTNGPFPASFYLFRHFNTVDSKCIIQFLPMTGFKLQTSGSEATTLCTNWATTTSNFIKFTLITICNVVLNKHCCGTGHPQASADQPSLFSNNFFFQKIE